VPNVVRTGLDRTVDDLADAVDLGDDYPERVSSLEPVGVPSTCRVDAVLSLFDVLLGNLEVVERCTKRFGTARERVGDGLGALAGRLDAEADDRLVRFRLYFPAGADRDFAVRFGCAGVRFGSGVRIRSRFVVRFRSGVAATERASRTARHRCRQPDTRGREELSSVHR